MTQVQEFIKLHVSKIHMCPCT